MSGLTAKDVDRILALADAIETGELDLAFGETRIVIRAGAAPSTRQAQVAVASATSETSEPQTPRPSAASDASAAVGAKSQGVPVASPLVGTFYHAPRPGASPFVRPGDRIGPDTVIGIVELMKLMNSVPAGIAGEVVEIVAKDGSSVQAGDTLMIVKPYE